MKRALKAVLIGLAMLVSGQSASAGNPIQELYDQMNQPVNPGTPSVSDPYLQKLTEYLNGGKLRDFDEPEDDREKIIKQTHMMLNAPALAGLFADWFKGKTYDDYVKERDSIVEDFLENADPFSDNFSLEKAWGEILTGIYAGYSLGWIPQPDTTKQYIPEGNRLIYSYRVGQQKVREATLLTEGKRILKLTKELNDMYRNFFAVCSCPKVEFKFPPNDTPDKPSVHCQCHAAGCCHCSCSCSYEGEFHYVPITSSLESMTKILVAEEQRTRKVLCADYLARILQLKTEVETAKMNLYNLSASYGLLENDERVKSGI